MKTITTEQKQIVIWYMNSDNKDMIKLCNYTTKDALKRKKEAMVLVQQLQIIQIKELN